jgi:predicted ATP-grasp superfamily ATP-dependent carboligase
VEGGDSTPASPGVARMSSTPQALTALVLDAQECHALAATRSLGRRGVRVTVASHKPDAMALASRYATDRLITPSPADAPVAYMRWLLATLDARHYDATLFFGETSANVILPHRAAVQARTGFPIPDLETFMVADRKDQVMRLAHRIGVRAPRTYELQSANDADTLAEQCEFPAIVKGVWGSCGHQVAVAGRREDLRPTVDRIAALRQDPSLPLPVVQDFIPGRGYGLSALCRQGEPLAVFMHRRLEEHDVARGTGLAHAAAGAESVDEPELREAGLALLRALRWDGVAMVEFRRSDRDGHFYLMEINPRFVGSLDLAIAAGVDLPWLYVQLAAGLPVDAPVTYRAGLKYRWLVSKNITQAFEAPGRFALAALSTLRHDTRSDISWSDPRPHALHLRAAAWWVREHLRGAPPHPAPAAPAVATAPAGVAHSAVTRSEAPNDNVPVA